jgi:hypothetical protein
MVRAAAILIVAILGHGLLMANAADATVPIHDASMESNRADSTPFLGSPSHDESCFVIQAVAKSAPFPSLAVAHSIAVPTDVPWNVSRSRADVTPPNHPPDIVRALLQVYLI